MSVAEGLVDALEAHALGAWPAAIVVQEDGWTLRATPGLDRARSNNALPGARPGAIACVERFAAAHGIRPGIQVSPLHRHAALDGELEARGWTVSWPVRVQVGAVAGFAATEPELVVSDEADTRWLACWEAAEGRDDGAAHAATVFAALRGRACFGRLGDAAVGLAVPGAGLTGLFCLAVRDDARRGGLGTRLVCGLCHVAGEPQAYLQVEQTNAAALGLYERLGFVDAYRYHHRQAP